MPQLADNMVSAQQRSSVLSLSTVSVRTFNHNMQNITPKMSKQADYSLLLILGQQPTAQIVTQPTKISDMPEIFA